MDRTQYLEIRKSEDLSIRKYALFTHYFVEILLAGAIFAIYQYSSSFPMKALAIPLTAALIFRNFSIMHDAAHKSVSKRVWLNDLIGVLGGAICLLPFEPWRRSHLEHHSWSGNIDKDPVMAIVKRFPTFSAKLKDRLSFFWKLWIPMLAMMQYGLFYLLAAKIFIAQRDSFKVLLSLGAPVVLWGSAFTFLPSGFTLAILLPAVLMYMIAVEVVNFPHHLQLPQYHGETRFAVWEQHQIARSCTYPRWFAHLIVLNFNYHVEHHMFPDVPWYHLEKLQLRIRPLLEDQYNTDEQFAWIIKNRPKHLSQVVPLRQAPEADRKSA